MMFWSWFKSTIYSIGAYIFYKWFCINPEFCVKFLYYINTKKRLDFNEISTYQEKIQWLKVYDNNPLIPICADKYEMRKFVKAKNLGHILPKILGVYDDVKEINIAKLPNRFVMKLSHGWNYNIIVKNKELIDFKKVRKQIKKWKNRRFGCYTGEKQYFNLKSKILCEEYMEDKQGNLFDYKVFCFEGQPLYIQVDSDRFDIHKRTFYTTNWEMMPVKCNYENSEEIIERPRKLKELLQYSKVLSEDFHHVRVDFYIVDGVIKLGELTFTPSAGYADFEPNNINYIWGEKIIIKR